jgi:serine phosphatase RsbU (regulator of sigma subunit)
MSSRRSFAWIMVSLATAFCVSGLLYRQSRSADLRKHGRALAVIERVRHLDRLLSEQVRAARFAALDQHDSIDATETEIDQAEADLAYRVADVMPIDAALDHALRELTTATTSKRDAAAGFNTHNTLLRAATYALPKDANDLVRRIVFRPAADNDMADTSCVAIQRLAQTGLAYNLHGDDLARRSHLQALAEVQAQEAGLPADFREQVDVLLAQAQTIKREVPLVTAWIERIEKTGPSDALAVIQYECQARFDAIVSVSDLCRKVLYGWSLGLLGAVGFAALRLRAAQVALELRVAERTAELRSACASLWGEMKLARKIQEALVPVAPVLSNGEIAARMQPTDEVGGDYYDVIRTKDCDWILIGDVSGHGVPAGLIMMMCHTAVRTVLDCNPDIGPDGLLARVNSVLTRNIRQLGEDKYMTISAFRWSADGSIEFAGAHQDVHVYRAATGAIEMLPSCGIWLGIEEDIAAALKTQRFRVEPGDLVLLHTDGVTEAMRQGVMFDTGGLRRVLGAAEGKSPGQVVLDVFAGLEGFQVVDDATVVVLKAAERMIVPRTSVLRAASSTPRLTGLASATAPISGAGGGGGELA